MLNNFSSLFKYLEVSMLINHSLGKLNFAFVIFLIFFFLHSSSSLLMIITAAL